MPAHLTDIDSTLFATVVGGDWQRTYASRKASGQCVFVFQRRGDPGDILVLRNDDACPGASELQVPGHGEMYCHSYINDPALAGLQDVLDRYDSCQVLRYRPGKRITIAARDGQHGPVIVKCVRNGVTDIYDGLRAAWEARNELAFAVGCPIACFPGSNTFVQTRVPGVPIDLIGSAFDSALVTKMALALSSLHRSTTTFPQRFDTGAQQLRSNRYARFIQSHMPDLAGLVDELCNELDGLGRRLQDRPHEFVPIHGSLHSHQWLRDDNQLALVDFDRAAMGYAELDIATFLAEFDYESPAFGTSVNRLFLAEFDQYDSSTLNYFRAHKHLAKAFKASRIPQPTTARRKTQRNLGRALQLLAEERS